MTVYENNKTKISVIIPTYNSEKTVINAISSAMAQTIKPEIIVIDDASSDNTVQLINKIKYPFLKIIPLLYNCGPGACRNIGISNSSGEFIAFLDADDTYPNKKSLHKMYEMAIQYHVDICGSYRESLISGKIKKEKKFRNIIIQRKKIIDFASDQWEFDFTNYIYKSEMIKTDGISFPEYRRYQDVPFLIQSMHVSKRFAIYPIVGYRYNFSENKILNLSESATLDLLRCMLYTLKISKEFGYGKIINRTLNRLENEYAELIKKHNSAEIQNLLDEIKTYYTIQ